jgi:glycerate dehydrogenase
MRVLFAARKGEQNPKNGHTAFDQFLAESDIITLHCPLNDHTRDLINTPEFELMRRKPILINTARGGLVNEPALANALRQCRISAAGFDVTTPEPPDNQNALIQLLDMPNFILTPHVAWASEQAIQVLADQLIDNIEAYHQGTPRNVVAAPVSA